MRARAVLFALPVLFCLGLSLAVFACGEAGSEEAPTGAKDPLSAPFVRARDIEEYPAKSPERAFLSWWQGLQYQDTSISYRYVDPGLRRQRPQSRYRRDASFALPAFLGKPEIVSRTKSGDQRARLAVNIRFFERGSAVSLTPRNFRLVESAEGWRLATLDYFDQAAREGRARARAAAAGGG